MAFSAFLDTCVLVLSRGRDVLLEVAECGVYRPLWSSAVLEELSRTLHRLMSHNADAAPEADAYVRRLVEQMSETFPDALVEGWEPVQGSLDLPDPNDRHVVAAALIGRADVIVTDNTKDFPPDHLPRPLFTQTADEFLLDSLDLHPDAVVSAAVRVAGRTGRHGPPMTPRDIADYLAATSMPTFGAAIRRRVSTLGGAALPAWSANSPHEAQPGAHVHNGGQRIGAGQRVPRNNEGHSRVPGRASASTSSEGQAACSGGAVDGHGAMLAAGPSCAGESEPRPSGALLTLRAALICSTRMSACPACRASSSIM